MALLLGLGGSTDDVLLDGSLGPGISLSGGYKVDIHISNTLSITCTFMVILT